MSSVDYVFRVANMAQQMRLAGIQGTYVFYGTKPFPMGHVYFFPRPASNDNEIVRKP